MLVRGDNAAASKNAAVRILADDPSVDAFYALDDEVASGVIGSGAGLADSFC